MQAAGDTISVKLGKDFNGVVAAVLGAAGTDGGAVGVGGTARVEISADDGANWEIATLKKPDGTTTAVLAPGQSGWCEAPGYTDARLWLIAITSGSYGGRMAWRKG